MGVWFAKPLLPVQTKKPFLIISCVYIYCFLMVTWYSLIFISVVMQYLLMAISCMIYLCDFVTPGHHIKSKLLELFNDHPATALYKLGFLNEWEKESLWKLDNI